MFEAAEGVIIGAQSTSLSEDSLFCVVLVMILVLQILLTAGMVIIIMKHIDSSRDLRNILRKVDKMEEKLARNAGKRQKEKIFVSYGNENDTPPLANVYYQESTDNIVQNSDRQKSMETQPDSSNQVINNLADRCQCCGLSVNGSVHYNPEGPAKFDVKELEEAEFVLRSDMTVIPVSSSFLGYNNDQYYRSREFFVVYDFQDKNGRDVVWQEPVKLVAVQKPAVVEKIDNGYQLLKKGILIVEKK